MELPSDIPYLEIEVPESSLKLEMIPSDPGNLKATTQIILERLHSAKSPAFLLDMDALRFDVSRQIVELAERFKMQVAVMNCAKGAFPENSGHYVGTYVGSIASSPATRDAIEGSDCLLTVGYRRVETTTGFFTDKLPASGIHLNSDSVDTAGKTFQGVYIAELLQSLVDSSTGIVAKKPPRPSKPSPIIPSDDPLTQDAYWKAIQNFLRPGDVIVVEDGASSAGMGRLTLPDDSTYITGAFVWCSIGYATPALLGAILASAGRRHILLTGEGSLQLPAGRAHRGR